MNSREKFKHCSTASASTDTLFFGRAISAVTRLPVALKQALGSLVRLTSFPRVTAVYTLIHKEGEFQWSSGMNTWFLT